MNVDKVSLAIIIVIALLIVIMATHVPAQNTAIRVSQQTMPNFNKTFIHNSTANVSMLYYITPDPASIEENASTYQPLIVDHGDGNVTFLIASAISKDNPEGVSIMYYFMADASVYYEIYPTRNSSSAPWDTNIVRSIDITDDLGSSDDRNLSIEITPLADGNGTLSITARTPEGKYKINGTIQNPLNIKQQPLYDVGFGFQVDNGSIQYDNQTLKLATIHARNEIYYVLSNDSINLD